MENYEQDIKDLIERMTRQQQKGMPSQQQPQAFDMGTDQSPHLFNQRNTGNNVDQSPIDNVNSVRPMGPPIARTGRKIENTGVKPVDGGCPQCGLIHPPIQPGTRCPNAQVKVKSTTGEEKTIDVNKYVTDLKNIIISQAEMKKVRDMDKLFKNIILAVTKFIEEYTE